MLWKMPPRSRSQQIGGVAGHLYGLGPSTDWNAMMNEPQAERCQLPSGSHKEAASLRAHSILGAMLRMNTRYLVLPPDRWHSCRLSPIEFGASRALYAVIATLQAERCYRIDESHFFIASLCTNPSLGARLIVNHQRRPALSRDRRHSCRRSPYAQFGANRHADTIPCALPSGEMPSE